MDQSKFNWEEVAAELLSKKDGRMKLNKLKRRVVGECVSRGAAGSRSEEQLGARFDKRLSRSRRFRVQKDFVTLVEQASGDW